MVSIVFSITLLLSLLVFSFGSAYAALVDKIDAGYTVQNGKNGGTFLNVLPEFQVSMDEAGETEPPTVRFAAVAALLNAIYAEPTSEVAVTKINLPIYQAATLPTKDKGKINRVYVYAKVLEVDGNNSNDLPLAFSFSGVPADIPMVTLKPLIEDYLSTALGYCVAADGVSRLQKDGADVKRFVAITSGPSFKPMAD